MHKSKSKGLFSKVPVITAILIVVLLLGSALSVFLTQKPTNLFSDASSVPVSFNKAAVFSSAKNSYVVLNQSKSVGNFSNVRLEALVNYQTSPGVTNYPIISKRFVPSANNDSVFSYMLEITQEGKVKFIYSVLYGNTWQPVGFESKSVIAPNTWHHVAVAYNSVPNTIDTGKLMLFIDGKKDSEIAQAGEIGGGSTTNYLSNVLIGTDPSMSYSFNGLIDEVRISNVSGDVGSNYEVTAPFTMDATTLALLHFDDSNLTAPRVESSLAGITTRAAGIEYAENSFSGVGFFQPDNSGKAIYLNGTNYLELKPINNAIDLTKDFTFEAWVNMQNRTQGVFPLFGYYLYNQNRGKINSLLNLKTKWSYANGQLIEFGTASSYKDLPLNGWKHIALVKKNSQYTGYLNGSEVFSYPSEAVAQVGTPLVALGAVQTGPTLVPYYLNAFVDEFRFSSVAREVPTLWQAGTYQKALTKDVNTVLLFNFEGSAEIITPQNDVEIIPHGSSEFVPGYAEPPIVVPPSPSPTPLVNLPSPRPISTGLPRVIRN